VKIPPCFSTIALYKKGQNLTNEFENRGKQIRQQSKELVFDYMISSNECQNNSNGITLAKLFRDCGFDWGEYEKATSSNQQYWCVALVRELEKEQKVVRLENKKWRLK